VNSRKTFDALDSWVAEATKYGAKSTVVAVCGNKSDGGNRAVSEKDGKDWAAKNGFMYVMCCFLTFRFFETSAQSGQQVNEMFEAILKQILASYFG
jgi:GTPase SAR1 family protein